MDRWDSGALTERQYERVSSWCPDPQLVEDLSWGLVDTTVLRIRSRGRDLVVKAAGPANHHIDREIRAHESYTRPLVRRGRTARMRHADRAEHVVVLDYLEGSLAEGRAEEFGEAIHAEAGELLRAMHDQESRVDDEYEARVTQKSLAWLDRDHRIDPSVEHAARQTLRAYRPLPITVVPTHGDWHPRNWIVHHGKVYVIDFGRFEFRPAATDLCRLAAKQWRRDSRLEAAFLRGYGADPRDAEVWRIDMLREAVATAVWAYQIGDEEFEAQGHRMLIDALDRF